MRGLPLMVLAGLLCTCAVAAQAASARRADAAGQAVAQPPFAFLQYVSDDAVKQISAQWPAATQPLLLSRPFVSPVQQYILAGLREQGFAVEESASVADARRRRVAGSAPGEYSRGLFKVDPLLLDVRTGAAANDLFYIRVNVGDAVLSRGYVLTADGATPAGAWIRREDGK